MASKKSTHYDVLRVEPTASQREIQVAYQEALKRVRAENDYTFTETQVLRAYKTLGDLVARAKYDNELQGSGAVRRQADATGKQRVRGDLKGGKEKKDSPVHYKTVMAILLAAGLLICALIYIPMLRDETGKFEVGQTLYDESMVLGTVLDIERRHKFPNGKSTRAFLIREPDGTEKWYPAYDLRGFFARD